MDVDMSRAEKVTLETRHQFEGRVRCWDCFVLVERGAERLRGGVHRCPDCHAKGGDE